MTGAWTLLRHFLRRDRWQLLWWTLGATVLYWSQAVSIEGLYATQAELDLAAASMEGNAALIAMTGPARALDTVGGQVTWQASAFGAVVAGLMTMFLVGRHTRAEEESGRDETLRASAVARHAPMTAALGTALAGSVLLGLGVSASLVAHGLAVPDSLALGVGLTLCGAVFAGTALVAAQLTASTRSMYGIAGAVIGVAYALRAVGDLGTPVLTWLSPIGWYQGMHPFSGVRWWPVLLFAAAALGLVASAYAVFGRRDHAAGVLAARPGPARAGRRLAHASGLGLAWRLQRGSILGWTAGLVLVGLAYGSLGDGVGDLIGDSETARELMTGPTDDLVEGFYATAMLMLALLASGFAVSSALRPRAEEDDGRVEALLATGLRRSTWLASHVLVTLVGVALTLLGAGLGLGTGYALTTGDTGALATYTAGTSGYAAPVLVLAGVTRLLVGVVPRAATLAWLGLVWCVVVLFFGPLLRLPEWVQDLSPFHHLALVPAEDFGWLPFVVVLACAAAASVAGQVAFARRDLR